MPRSFLSTAALLATCTVFSAHAAVVNASFTGLVETQTSTGFAVNAPISGSFAYDTGSASFLSFSIGGFNVAPGYGSSAAFSPDLYSALYTAQLSPVQQGGTLNSSFTLDLEAASNPWSASSAVALLGDAPQLASDLDLSSSFFSFYTGNSDGTQVHSLTAGLTGLTVVGPVPEPGTYALMVFGLGALALRMGQRRR